MAHSSEAYDFTLFESRVDNTAAAVQPKKKEAPKKNIRENIVELPEKKLRQNSRKKIKPLKAVVMTVSFALVFATFLAVVYNQVRLTELTDEISLSTTKLEEAKSIGVLLQMQASEKMSSEEIEKYAKEVLGMTKVGDSQITFVNPTQDDHGVVLSEGTGSSFWGNIWSGIKSWFE